MFRLVDALSAILASSIDERMNRMLEQITVRDVRNINKYNIISSLMAQKDLSMNEIALRNNISVMTVKNIVDDLVKRNILFEQKAGMSFVGRKPYILNISSTVGQFLVIDLTSKVQMYYYLYNIYREKNRKVLYRCNHKKSYAENLEIFLGMVKKEIEEKQIKLLGIGVSIPGAYFAEEDRIYNELIPELNEISLKELLQKYFDLENIIIDLDVKLAAFAEMISMEPDVKEIRNLYYLFLGEGIGSAMVINGQIYSGTNSLAGEIGHILVCCGHDDYRNLESMISATTIQNELYREVKKRGITTVKGEEEFGLDKILELYDAGDEIIANYLENVFNILAKVVYNIIRLLDPSCIIIGGINREFCELAASKLEEKIGKMFENKLILCEIYVSKYEEGSAIIGCFEQVVNQWIINI